ncbi:MAG: hypothetical protein VXW83_08525 [SAR324 cluster bacterium]|nr:hypothetical protein [SAR324 cluster bacterium]
MYRTSRSDNQQASSVAYERRSLTIVSPPQLRLPKSAVGKLRFIPTGIPEPTQANHGEDTDGMLRRLGRKAPRTFSALF